MTAALDAWESSKTVHWGQLIVEEMTLSEIPDAIKTMQDWQEIAGQKKLSPHLNQNNFVMQKN